MLRIFRSSTTHVRRFGTNFKAFRISDEVKDALHAKQPVVALESTIITHGLPFPANVDMANEVEQIIRDYGCIPATTGFLQGSGVVGLSPAEIEALAGISNPEKISRRDIPNVVANRLSGGTTIASTMILAHKAGIRVFATGGLGGVHRGVADTWDISADLEELGRTPVAVVCSGPKSILDVPKTIEYLETKGVPVVTFGSGGVPGFFTADSGVPSPFNFQSPDDAAKLINAQTQFAMTGSEQLGSQGGFVFCVPCPEHLALPKDLVDGAIEQALISADREGITGKKVTPYLLKQVWKATGGDSVATNVEFVKNNARMAAQIAQSLANASRPPRIQMPTPLAPRPQPPPLQETAPGRKDVVAIGAICQDMTCTLNSENISPSSFPGHISTALGGTAYNAALASAYNGASTRLVSSVGEKERDAVLGAVSPALDVSGVQVSRNLRTARYVCMNDAKGDLIVACADMDNIAKLDPDHIVKELKRADPKVVILDANLGIEATSQVLKETRSSGRIVVYEPTSVPKSALLADQPDLKVFPNASIDIATPNLLELMSMFEEFSYKEKLDIDNWFPVIDSLPITDPLSQMKLDVFMRSSPGLANIVQSGLLQASMHLLPYIPNLFVTMGAEGLISFQLIEHLRDRTGGIRGGPSSAYILSNRRDFGMLIQHFPIPEKVPQELLKSVNGIGDTFCGTIAAQIAQNAAWLRDDGLLKLAVIERAQKAAALSLRTYETVNSDIADLKRLDVDEFLSR